MKLQFKYQQFQADAVDAVCNVFRGQPFKRAQFMVDRGDDNNVQLHGTEVIGWCNNALSPQLSTTVLRNLRDVQTKSGVRPLSTNVDYSLNDKLALTIEMETGTGKTYTYIKTIFELNKRYGWSKFIVVVPSIAIREGVYKSFQITQDHFADDYDGKRCRFFIYDSSHLADIRSFAAGDGINVMIMNTQAFNARGEAARRINRELDEFNGVKPIDSIAATRPIIIIDEPQSVLGKQTRSRLRDFKPLFYLLYSATHKESFNKVYRLDAVDAYQKKLVKRISVKGIEKVGDTASQGYLYLERINVSSKSNPTATVTMEYSAADGSGKLIKRSHTLKVGENIYDYSGGIESYRHGYQITDIDAMAGTVSFTGNFDIHEGEILGETNEVDIRRLQIVETIKSHLERELQLYSQGIKVLSLFFIDEVAKYKQYGEGGVEIDGVYAQIFQREYARQVKAMLNRLEQTNENPDYAAYLRRWQESDCRVDAGYFSIDKKGHAVNGKVSRGESDDVSAYDLIMKNKERLLSFDEPVRFIFSHSALREGWDNPNVFQICTLGNPGAGASEIKKRQEIGRGLRLAVDQNGVRQDAETVGDDSVQSINILTVIANESYDAFAKALQNEYADVANGRPKVLTMALVKGFYYTDGDGHKVDVSEDSCAIIYSKLSESELIDNSLPSAMYTGMPQCEKLAAVRGVLGDQFSNIAESVADMLDSIYDAKKMRPTNARHTVRMTLRREIIDRPEFDELWRHINQRTYYQVNASEPELIHECVNAINCGLSVSKTQLVVKQGDMGNISYVGEGNAMTMQHNRYHNVDLNVDNDVKFDLVGEIASETNLLRSTVANILNELAPSTFGKFCVNPEEFIRKCIQLINQTKPQLIVKNITYQPIEGKVMGKSDVFKGVIDVDDEAMCREARKHIYDHVRFDSQIERSLSEQMDQDCDIDFYIKLPSKFTVHTPLGEYNPDWAIVASSSENKKIYMVAESKGTTQAPNLRPVEQAKIYCAKEHFAAISDSFIKYDVVSNINEVRTLMDK